MRRKRILWIAPAAIIGMAVFAFIGGEVVLHLWNWLVPSLFGWKQLTFWQALALLALCRILFGGFGMRGGGMQRSMFRRRMAERWDHMSPEEREKFCQGLHGRWGRENSQPGV
jgi:uncharacterized membrane protein